GGTSVGNGDSVKAVLNIVKHAYDKGEKSVVVLSAMAGVTNVLTKMAENAAARISFAEDLKIVEERHFEVVKKLIAVKYQNPVFTKLKLMLNELEDILQGINALRELSLQSKDLVVSFGERLSNYMVSKIMEQDVEQALYIDASHYIKTDS